MAGQESETTLGTGRLLALFFGVVLLCAVFFVTGYRLGKSSSSPAASAGNAVSPAAAADPMVKPEPSQTAGTKPDCANAPAGCAPAANPATLATPAPVTVAPPVKAAAPGPSSAAPARPIPQSQAPAPAPPPPAAGKAASGGYAVQVAAVSKQQDAEALVAALRKKQYPVFIATSPTDPLFHVQIGPFNDQKYAESIRNRLVADGYNPILKK